MAALDGRPLVTVLTAARNAEVHIAEAIESIRAQTFSDWEYIIVDDASSDNTSTIIARYASIDHRIRIVRRNERGGPYVAANQGFAQAKGRYVARLDSDDVALPRRLERQLEFLSANPRLRACASEVMLLEDGRSRAMRDEFPILPGSLKWRFFFRTLMPSTTLIETSAWADVGGFKELPLSQDLRLWCDLARRRWLGVVPEPLVRWRVHDQQLSAQHYDLQQALALDVFRDHLAELSAGDWSEDDVDRLRWIIVRPIGLRHARRVLARWEELWGRDTTLTRDERRELAKMTRWLRVKHVRLEAREALASRRWGSRFLDVRRRIRRSFGV
jgi:glycosyltransferase involved in cell wall biosynthesis